MADLPPLSYGPGVPGEAELRLCGDPQGLRVIEIGGVDNAVALAARGGRAIAVTTSPEDIARGRDLAARAETRVEFHEGDLADLGFATSASVDLVLCVWNFATTPDLARVLRQVHRVLRPEAPLVFTVPHPMAAMVDGGHVVAAYGAAGPTLSDYAMALLRASFRIELMLEPGPVGRPEAPVPGSLVVRARKQGV